MPWPGRGRRVGALLGISPLERAPFTIPGSVSHVDKLRRGSCPGRACLREPSHLASIARPELRRLGSRTQDLPARCGRSNPRATVRRRSSLENRSRRFSTPTASPAPLAENRASCLRPLSAAPRASRVLHDRYPGGVPTAGPRRRSVKPCWWADLLRGQPSLGVSFLFESAREFELAAVHGLSDLRAVRPYSRFTSGGAFRRRNDHDPSSHRSVRSPGPAAFAVESSLEVRLVSVTELSEPLRARPAARCGSRPCPSRGSGSRRS